MKSIFSLFIFFSFYSGVFAQDNTDLRQKLTEIISKQDAEIGISLRMIENNDSLTINGNLNAPMMSVFKFHIALAVLDLVDKGKLSLNQKIFVRKTDLHADTWSPMRDDYPEGNVYLTLDKILRYTVSDSDNNGCDILIDLVGGTKAIQDYIDKIDVKDFTIKVNEQQMSTWENCYLNTTTPIAMTDLLVDFYKGKILKKKSTKYLIQLMEQNSRGTTWMKGQLPKNTVVAHRTGISNQNDAGLRVAHNDVGIITLPNGKHFVLSIFQKNIKNQTQEISAQTMAELTKVIWDYYLN
ncbi:beta-lactamase class A [Algoriella xinjiangensis]|uniref:beta-lactamase n=1 Tax=Algoriella xinjiangensis TaxID=684065 RepID=A0A1I4Y847_9FLAO|nr:class A beta-lactamase, subclass A2 [Algoriella xinjiangensis]SFN33933.1 beta-lactamase class A [Algoriella xinjiangensis]VDH15237.1 Extended-spectrum beta-lactamase PER-1 precursor [Algoriella xinjiangensis]